MSIGLRRRADRDRLDRQDLERPTMVDQPSHTSGQPVGLSSVGTGGGWPRCWRGIGILPGCPPARGSDGRP